MKTTYNTVCTGVGVRVPAGHGVARRINKWTIDRGWTGFREANKKWGIPGQATAGGPTSTRTEAVWPLELRRATVPHENKEYKLTFTACCYGQALF